MDNQIAEKSHYWANSTVFDEKTRKEIQDLINKGATKDLEDRFYRDLEFGTGGLRGILGAGTSRMNIFNIRKATTALAEYLKSFHNQNDPIKVAISFDSRIRSDEFARAACEVFAAHGIISLLTEDLRPVPMLSFMVRHFSCQAGICVTASHNPPEYNGYKVYWQDGSQLVPPHDSEIIDRYNTIKGYETLKYMDFDQAQSQGLVHTIGRELDDAYFEKLQNWSRRPELDKSNLGIAFSPLHGTGAFPVVRGLRLFGFKKVFCVPEQEKPDGRFPTVTSPNPEDPESLEMAVSLAKNHGCDLVLATDPDADRIGLVVKEENTFASFNGNQIGSLLLDYVLKTAVEKNLLPDNPLVIKTIVTTDLQNAIAASYGVHCEETLTGFKWICNLVEKYHSGQIRPQKNFVCGGEESYGFLAGDFVRDKDAIISCCIAAEMVAYYKSIGKTLTNILDDLFQKFGVYQESLFSLNLPGKEGQQRVMRIMSGLRTSPPKDIAGLPVASYLDVKTGWRFLLTERGFEKQERIDLPQSNVLQFVLQDQTKVSVRPSGTEPKIKFYISANQAAGAQISQTKAILHKKVSKTETAFVELAKSL